MAARSSEPSRSPHTRRSSAVSNPKYPMCGVRPRSTYCPTVMSGGSSGCCGHVGDEPGQTLGRQRRHRHPVDPDRPVVGDEAGHGSEQGGLPGAVGPDDPHPLPRPDLLGQVRQRRDRVVAHRDARRTRSRRDLHVLRPTRRERRTNKKNGAPTNAVTTPIGISLGASTVRAATSATMRKAAPPIIDTGTTTR